MSLSLNSLLDYSRKKVKQYGAPYEAFGIFCLLNYIVPFFIWMQPLAQYEDTLIYLRIVGALLCVLLILKEEWPIFTESYLPFLWHLTVGYCLPFTSTVTFILSGFNPDWLVSMLAVTILLFIVLDWATAGFVAGVGLMVGLLFCKLITGFPTANSTSHTSYLFIYQGIFGLLIGFIFARRKEETFDTVLRRNHQLSEVQQDARQNLAEVLSYRERLLTEISSDNMAFFDDMTAAYIRQVIYRITDYLRLKVTSFEVQALQKGIADLYSRPGIDQSELSLSFTNHNQATHIEGDFLQLRQLLNVSLQYLQQHNPTQRVMHIAIEDAQLGHPVKHMKGYTRTLQAIRITLSTTPKVPAILPIYMIEPDESTSWGLKPEHDTYMFVCGRIVDAHYGCMPEPTTDTLVYVIPVNLREIRGKVMELLREPAKEDPEELKNPVAIRLEQELMAKIQFYNINLGTIQKALSVIKRYHGGVKRKSGEPFFTHPIAVALIVLEYNKDQDAILAALLHDTVEDTSLSLLDIERNFGETVAFLVAKATNLEDYKRRISLSDKENITRIINYEDPRAPLIKLADRLHNMRTIQFHKPAKQQVIAQETLQEFVPLAKKLGLLSLAEELAQRSKAVLEQLS